MSRALLSQPDASYCLHKLMRVCMCVGTVVQNNVRVQIMLAIRAKDCAIRLQLAETWMREYQVCGSTLSAVMQCELVKRGVCIC